MRKRRLERPWPETLESHPQLGSADPPKPHGLKAWQPPSLPFISIGRSAWAHGSFPCWHSIPTPITARPPAKNQLTKSSRWVNFTPNLHAHRGCRDTALKQVSRTQ